MPRLEAEDFDASAARPQKNCLCLTSLSTSLPRSRLGVRLPWLVPIAAALVVTLWQWHLTPSSLLIFMFTVSGLLSHFTNSNICALGHLYVILVLASPRHSLGLPLPRLEHLLPCLDSTSRLTASASPRPLKNASTASLPSYAVSTGSESMNPSNTSSSLLPTKFHNYPTSIPS